MGFKDTFNKIIWHYSQFYFVTIAIILGSGVLGLPITLYDSGFRPFLITITLSYIVQILLLLFFTEVLQKFYYRKIEILQESDDDNVPIQIDTHELPTYGSQTDLIAKRVYSTETIEQCLPNLHSLGEFFLPSFLPYLFTLTLLFQMIVFLTSYVLAGSQAISVLFQVNYATIIPIFCWTWTLVVILFHSFITPFISILTLLKGSLFAATVFITFFIGLKTQEPVVTNYGATADSLLMTAIALGSYINIMPLLFAKVKQTRDDIIGFNISIFLGLTTCFILDIFWCWAILAIVPQHSVCLKNNMNQTIRMTSLLFNESQSQDQCIYSPSLKNSALNGEISTVPLSIIFKDEKYASYHYVSILIQLFVAISISVSFITLGSVLYHTLKGVVNSYWTAPFESETKHGNILKYITARQTCQWFVALIIFTFVFVMASTNPKGFKAILEQAGSFTINIEFGFFIVLMIYKVTSSEYNSCVIPFQLPRWFRPFQYLIPIYYFFGLVYNIIVTIRHPFFLKN